MIYVRPPFFFEREWIILKPIYYADQMVTAYEIAMGLPEARRMTNDDGNFKTEVTQQHINKAFEKALAAAELPTDWNGLVDRMRDCLLAKELAVGETVLFVATEPYGGPGDFCLRGGVVEAIDPEHGTCTIRGKFFPMGNVPLHYVLGRYDRDVSEEHYGFQNVRPLLGEHPELAERYLREVEAKWNASYEHSAVTPEISPGPVLGGLGT